MKTPNKLTTEQMLENRVLELWNNFKERFISGNTFEKEIRPVLQQLWSEALTQGRKEGREQGIRESAEVAEKKFEYRREASLQKLAGFAIAHDILSLLTHPSPKEQEK